MKRFLTLLTIVMLALTTTFNAVQAKPFNYAVYQQHLTKSGKPDKRYNENKHLKKDGTMDMRYKTSKKAAKKKTK